eukprot:27183-Eustigmatos_ZCMA.PRE.1
MMIKFTMRISDSLKNDVEFQRRMLLAKFDSLVKDKEAMEFIRDAVARGGAPPHMVERCEKIVIEKVQQIAELRPQVDAVLDEQEAEKKET